MAEESHVFSTEQENISDNQNKKVEKTILENFSKITNKQFSVRVKSSLDLLQYLSQVDEVCFYIQNYFCVSIVVFRKTLKLNMPLIG